MYYEEKVIDGILHHQGTPDGEWIPYTAENLTMRYVWLKQQYDQAKQRAYIFKARNVAAMDALQGHGDVAL